MAKAKPTVVVLNEAHWQAIQQARARLPAIHAAIERATCNGLDCQDHKQTLEAASAALDNLAETWFDKSGKPKPL